MMFDDKYLSVEKTSEALLKEKGSKFLSFVYPVKTDSEIKSLLNSLQKNHPNANHVCYAYVLGPQQIIYKSSDDGEPSGTAGKPILNAIRSNQLTDVLIAVVRYFGGTLLGTRGLIDAYRLAAENAIKENVIIEKWIEFNYRVEFPDQHMNGMQKLIKDFHVLIENRDYTSEHIYKLRVRKSISEQFEQKVKELYPSKITYIQNS